MTNRPMRSLVLLAALAAGGCAGPEGPSAVLAPRGTIAVQAARLTKAPTVTATDPSYGYQGETGKHVRIIGSGFATGAIASWERNGVADPKVTVLSTTVLSSTEIDATVNIASDASLSLYDVTVLNADKGKGIGTELFEVTTAISLGTLGGNTQINGATDNATGVAAVGWSLIGSTAYAVIWPGQNGSLESIGAGHANAIDVVGTTIGGNSGSQAAVWTLTSGSWTRSFLPVAAGAPQSEVYAIASDANGSALLIGGYEAVSGKGTSITLKPMLWQKSGTGWTRVPLVGASGHVRGVNARGQAVGGSDVGAAFWDSLGVRTALPGSGGPAMGIDAAGTIIAGVNAAGSTTKAVYWTAIIGSNGSRTWQGPFDLPGNCERAIGVDDFGRIAGHRCLVSSTRYTSAVWVPPYNVATSLTGFGDKTDAGTVWGISRRGSRLVGHAKWIGALWEGVVPPM